MILPFFEIYGNHISSYAEKIELIKKDVDNNAPLPDAVLDIYEIGKDGKKDIKLFSATTKEDGKLNVKTLKNYSDIKNPIDEGGNIDIPKGSYYIIEKKSPKMYLRNVKAEIFNVSDDKDKNSMVYVENKKMPQDRSQLIIRVEDETTHSGLIGSTLKLYKKIDKSYELLTTLTTDSDGYLLNSDKVDNYNGTLLLEPGEYKIVQDGVLGEYYLNEKPVLVTIEKNEISEVLIKNKHRVATDKNEKKKPKKQDEKLNKTGVKIRVVDKNSSKPIANQGIAVFEDRDGKEKKVFDGYTNSDGYLDAKNATLGKNMANEGIINLKPGKYYYKLTKYRNSVRHDFSVKKGVVGNQILKLNIEPGVKKQSEGVRNTPRLAKTGFESTAIYTVSGMSFILAGAILYKGNKSE